MSPTSLIPLSRVTTVLLVLSAGCTAKMTGSAESEDNGEDDRGGEGGKGDGKGTGGTPSGNAPPPVEVIDENGATCTVAPGPAPLRRLSNFEYRRTVDDLFDGVKPSTQVASLVGDNVKHFFDNDAAVQTVLRAEAEGYLTAAENVSAFVVKDLARLGGCGSAVNDGCLETYLADDLAPRAFRRPPSAEEKQAIVAVYRKTRERLDATESARAAIELVLQSPQFLYRPESPLEGGSNGNLALGPWDIASRLSYFLWGSMPDKTLMEAAQKNQLATREQVREHARRMLASPRALDSLHHFFGQWLLYKKVSEQSKNEALYPAFTPQIAADMVRESEMLVDHVLTGKAPYGDLFSASYTFRNRSLDTFYKGGRGDGDAFDRVDLAKERTAGLLTQGGLLAALSTADDSSPIFRGHFVRTHLLCDPLTLPATLEVPPLPPIDANATVRTVHELHMKVEPCKTCHLLMDPIGFALENYDATGLWRDQYPNGNKIDGIGEIHGVDTPRDVDGKVNGPGELGRKLAESNTVRECMARNLFEFALGRSYDEDLDQCAVKYLAKALSEANGRFDELVVTLVTSDAFMRVKARE